MRVIRVPYFRIVLFYLIAGFSWIYLSDWLVQSIFESPAAITTFQNIKGWAFIIVTALLLFFLIKRDFNALSKANKEVVKSYEQTIRGWVRVMDIRHRETLDHTERVTKMTLELARLSGITNKQELQRIEQGAILHDIGKIGIPDSILIKPGKLNEEEWALMKTHPEIAYEILSKINYLGASMDIPYCHHEKWDGTGYPRGLSGESIPVAARIFAIIDVWDALSHTRVYKPAWAEDRVLNYIREQSSKHFDPVVVSLFLQYYPQIKQKSVLSHPAAPPNQKHSSIEIECYQLHGPII